MNRQSFLLMAAVACVSSVRAETVSTVDDLVKALSDARGNNSTIVLAKGRYDVSAQAMKTYNAKKQTEGDSCSHLSISRVTLRGETDDPRDTVIYCNGTNRLFYCYNGYIHNLTISNGYAAADSGGGVLSLNTSTVLSNVVVTCCRSAGYGGGVSNTGCLDCDICANVSENSGGGAYRSKLTGCRVFDNVSNKDGGGAHQTIVTGGCRVYGNSAKSGGGGVSNWYSKDGVAQAWLYDSTVISNTATTGGGVYNMVVSNCVVACNRATDGGGIAHLSVIEDSVVSNNVASGSGGGVYAQGTGDANVVTVARSLIVGNAAAAGGGTYNCFVGETTMADNFIEGEQGAGAWGGALDGCVLSNNVSAASGTGLYGVASVSNCVLYAAPFAEVGAFVNCRICGYTNGWVLAEGANAATNGHFVGQATLSAGTFAARNTLFADNRVANVFNGYHTSGIAFENCTVAGNRFSNTFQNFGTTAYAPCRLVNTLFAGNASLDGATAYGATFGGTQKLAFTNCLFGAATSSTNNLPYPPVDCRVGIDPRFDAKNTEDPYSLRRTSPACGAGLVMAWMEGATDVRNDSRYPRLRGEKVDVGCYQCWLTPNGLLMIFR